MKRVIAAAALWVAFIGVALAQVPAPVQQAPSRLDASTGFQTSNTSAATITIPGVAGNFVYVTAVEIQNCAGGTTVTGAAPTTLTTTNLGGAAFTIGSGGAGAGQCVPSPTNGEFAGPLKSAAQGTNVTFVLPTFATNQTLRVNVWYYYAP